MVARRSPAQEQVRQFSPYHPSAGTSLFVRWLAVLDTIVVAIVIATVAPGIPQGSFLQRFALILLVPAYQALFRTFGLYESHRLQGFKGALRSLLTAEFVGGILGLSGVVIMVGTEFISAFLRFALVNTALLAIGRFALYQILMLARRRGMDRRCVCVIGSWEKAHEIEEVLAGRPEWGMSISVVGITLKGGNRQFLRFPTRESIGEDLSEILHREVIDEVVIAVPAERLPSERTTIALCEQFGVLGRVMIDYKTEEASEAPIQGEIPFANAATLGSRHLVLKRVLDIAGALAGIVLTGIPMALIMILTRISSPGPAIFRQRRTGLNGREFTIYKFRTMVDGADNTIMPANRSITKGPIFKDSADFRVTNVGHFLRRYSLDELPQFFNVLKGDMSLVGPRPLPVREANAIVGANRRRFRVLPGLTGLWQVSGRNDVEFEQWMKYDLDYVDNWSFGLDVRVLLKTVPVVLTGKGAY